MVSKAGTCAVAKAPFVGAMYAVFFEDGGLLGFGGDESEWLVRGVSPLASEACLFCAKARELVLKTEDALLASELAEPIPRSVSPESD